MAIEGNEYFKFNWGGRQHKARYESDLERKVREHLNEMAEKMNRQEEERFNHPAFCKQGIRILLDIDQPDMFSKPIEQFFDVSEAIIIEH